MPGDHDAATACGVVGRAQVFGCETGFGARGVEGCGGVVGADAPQVENGRGGEEVLGAAGTVLGGAAGEEDGVAGEEVGVDAFVGIFGEDGVVWFEGVFLEEILAGGGCVSGGEILGRGRGGMEVPFGLDVEERVLEAEKLVGGHGCVIEGDLVWFGCGVWVMFCS